MGPPAPRHAHQSQWCPARMSLDSSRSTLSLQPCNAIQAATFTLEEYTVNISTTTDIPVNTMEIKDTHNEAEREATILSENKEHNSSTDPPETMDQMNKNPVDNNVNLELWTTLGTTEHIKATLASMAASPKEPLCFALRNPGNLTKNQTHQHPNTSIAFTMDSFKSKSDYAKYELGQGLKENQMTDPAPLVHGLYTWPTKSVIISKACLNSRKRQWKLLRTLSLGYFQTSIFAAKDNALSIGVFADPSVPDIHNDKHLQAFIAVFMVLLFLKNNRDSKDLCWFWMINNDTSSYNLFADSFAMLKKNTCLQKYKLKFPIDELNKEMQHSHEVVITLICRLLDRLETLLPLITWELAQNMHHYKVMATAEVRIKGQLMALGVQSATEATQQVLNKTMTHGLPSITQLVKESLQPSKNSKGRSRPPPLSKPKDNQPNNKNNLTCNPPTTTNTHNTNTHSNNNKNTTNNNKNNSNLNNCTTGNTNNSKQTGKTNPPNNNSSSNLTNQNNNNHNNNHNWGGSNKTNSNNSGKLKKTNGNNKRKCTGNRHGNNNNKPKNNNSHHNNNNNNNNNRNNGNKTNKKAKKEQP